MRPPVEPREPHHSYLGMTEVMRRQWKQVMGSEPCDKPMALGLP